MIHGTLPEYLGTLVLLLGLRNGGGSVFAYIEKFSMTGCAKLLRKDFHSSDLLSTQHSYTMIGLYPNA